MTHKWTVATYYTGPKPIRKHITAYVRDWAPHWAGFEPIDVWASSGSMAKRLAVTERMRRERARLLSALWVDGPDSEAQRAARTPDPTHTPAVRRVVAWEATADGSIPSADADEAYLDAAGCLISNAAVHAAAFRGVSLGSFFSRWPKARRKRLAAYLRHRDEKAGYR